MLAYGFAGKKQWDFALFKSIFMKYLCSVMLGDFYRKNTNLEGVTVF